MLQGLRNAITIPDLRRKLLYTLAILVVFRLAAHIPVPGVDQAALATFLQGGGGAAGFVSILNMLSGGAVERLSVMAVGVQAYITSTIVFQLLTPIIPALQRLSEEGEAGRRKLNQYQYWITVPLALLQAFGQVQLLNNMSGVTVVPNFGFSGENLLPTMTILVAMTAGSMLAVWLGELITEQGIGNGLSLIIFSGIVASTPEGLYRLIGRGAEQGGYGMSALFVALFLLMTALMMFVIVVVQEGERRIPVQYGKRVRGIKMYTGGSQFIPLRINMAGMIPLIFAQAFLQFPGIIASFFVGSSSEGVARFSQGVIDFFSQGTVWYGPIYFLAVVGFTYFYTDMMVQQQDLPGNLQKQGGFIPGVRPGPRTAEHINSIYRRITLVGALFLGTVAVLPWIVDQILNANMLITASGLLIVVGVVVDTVRQLEAQLTMRHYDGFIK
jgi:preprotein translocase subunit SecY